MAAADYEGNRARFSGFAAVYDRHRYRPPAILTDVLCRYAGVLRPDLVVDLGCATGPSTRLWAARAQRVVGIDPVEGMLETARAVTREANVEYRLGYGHETGLESGCADVVTCSQSFHWMEPTSTLAEIARILRPGGVFAAYHYRALPVSGLAALERAVQATYERIYDLEREHGLKKATRFYGKAGHTQALRDCSRFALVIEFALHKEDETSAERPLGGVESLGALQTLRKLGLDDDALGLDELRAVAQAHLGAGTAPVLVSYQVSLGVRPDVSR